MEDRLRPNEISLFGQRWHACVGVFYFGLGIFLGEGFRRWFPDGAAWLQLVGFLMFIAGAIWWGALWWRQPKAA